MTQATLGQVPLFLSQRGGRPSVSAAPFITAVTGTGTGKHFVDQTGQPIMMRAHVLWGLVTNAGRWGGTWQDDLDNAIDGLASIGVNALMTKPLGHTVTGGLDNTGEHWDNVAPFVGGDIGILNNTFWERVDYLLSSAAAAGITVLLNVAHYSSDLSSGPLAGSTSTTLGNYGTALGNRYKTRPNLCWLYGGDYFDGLTTELTALTTGITGTGDTHMLCIENMPETTSRKTLDTNTTMTTGTNLSDWNFVYSYNVTYDGVEFAYDEASPLPAVWSDGHFDQNSAGDRKLMRDLLWWALSSGSRGSIFGSEATWQWGSGALAALTTHDFPAIDQPVIWDTFGSLAGWHLLAPDTNNSFLTAGRGTHAAALTSGGGGGEYNNADPQDGFVSAGVTADGRLAVVYFPVDTTITVNPAELVASYEVFWVDPASGATTAESIASTYSPTGTNSLGGADRVLVFRAL